MRPIGIDEVLRRIIGKAIGWTLKTDIQESAGPLQTSTGLKGGAEAAIHAMKEIFDDDDTDAVILVDASNAFNALNRKVALHNIQIICPPFSTILINTYRAPSKLFITGGKHLLSQEGTTQGDNLAMALYGLATIPLQNILRINIPSVKQVWLADDATGAGKLQPLREWWDSIVSNGINIGYYINESKSWLILKDPTKLMETKRLFADTNIKITSEGKRHLGAAIANNNFRKEYATEKVSKWCKEIEQLSIYAKSQPQVAFSAFIHGIQHKYTYFLRTIQGMEEFILPLDKVLTETFFTNIVRFSN